MTEEAFLRYRMAVVERMPDSPSKRAMVKAIESRMKALRAGVPADLDTGTRALKSVGRAT